MNRSVEKLCFSARAECSRCVRTTEKYQQKLHRFKARLWLVRFPDDSLRMLECFRQEKSSIFRPRREAHPELSFGLVIRYGRRQACNLLNARAVASTSDNTNNNNNNNSWLLFLLSFQVVALWRSIRWCATFENDNNNNNLWLLFLLFCSSGRYKGRSSHQDKE